jgi:acyl carrier protein
MYENVKQFLVDELRVKAEDITMEAELSGDLGINSLELAELVLACEEKFNVVIEDDDLQQFNTVGDVVKYLESHNG